MGRPNVGKSTLFNRLAGRRIAVVEETPGITRDRLYADCEWEGKPFRLIDTGGLQSGKAPLLEQVRQQVQIAIEEADLVLLVVDGKEGLTSLDYEAAELLRKSGKPLLLVVSKVETKEREEQADDFYSLSLGQPIAVSALHGIEIGELLDRMAEHLAETAPTEEEEDVIKVAIVGRPNVGKSSLLNALLGEERAIVDAAPGTTRDSIDTQCQWGDQQLLLIDTAGVRRKSKVKESFEYYGVLRAFKSIERCDVALMVIDASEGVTDQDQRIAGFAHEEGRAQVVVVNKWDLVQQQILEQAEEEAPLSPQQNKTLIEDYNREIRRRLIFLSYAPVAFISALKREGLPALMDTVISVADQHALHIPTPELNRIVSEAVLARPLSIKGKPLKVYYATQPRVKPPTIALFVNDPELMHFSYLRYLENQVRKHFGLEGSPIRLRVRKSEGKEKKPT